VARTIVRVLLGAFLLLAGTGHLTFARAEFQAQVPPWLPLDPDLVVVASGIVELVLGLALLLVPRRARPLVGIVVAAFFVAVFPGNIAQWAEGRDGFGLDTDAARAIRLLFQPLLVIAALWSTGAWTAIGRRLRGHHHTPTEGSAHARHRP
jgi:uncharacterized membrane protein